MVRGFSRPVPYLAFLLYSNCASGNGTETRDTIYTEDNNQSTKQYNTITILTYSDGPSTKLPSRNSSNNIGLSRIMFSCIYCCNKASSQLILDSIFSFLPPMQLVKCQQKQWSNTTTNLINNLISSWSQRMRWIH